MFLIFSTLLYNVHICTVCTIVHAHMQSQEPKKVHNFHGVMIVFLSVILFKDLSREKFKLNKITRIFLDCPTFCFRLHLKEPCFKNVFSKIAIWGTKIIFLITEFRL